jgi:hypothetical protein
MRRLLHSLVLTLGVALASQGLTWTQGNEAAVAWIRALDSPDDSERASAIEGLTRMGKKAGEQLIAELGSTAASGRTRTGVIEVLGGMKRTGVTLLENEILQPIHGGSIGKIMSALGAIQDSGPRATWTIPSLVKLIERKPDKAFIEIHMLVRACAIMAVGRQGPSTPAVTKLLEKELKEKDAGVRLSSACALWWTGGDAVTVLPVLLEGLEETSAVALERAVFGLGEMGPQAKAATAELESLRDKVSAETRTVIVDALAKIGGHRPPIGPRSG